MSTVNSLIIFRSLISYFFFFLWNSRPRCESVQGPSSSNIPCCVVTLLLLLACFVLIFMASSCHFHNVAFDTFPLGSTNRNHTYTALHVPYYLTLYGRLPGIAHLVHLASQSFFQILCKMFLWNDICSWHDDNCQRALGRHLFRICFRRGKQDLCSSRSKVADWKWLRLRQKLKPWLIVMHEGFKATFLSIKYFH